MDEVQLPQGYRAMTRKQFTFFTVSFQIFLVLIWLTLEGWKAESTLEPASGFELGTPGLGIQRLNNHIISLWVSQNFFTTKKTKHPYKNMLFKGNYNADLHIFFSKYQLWIV